MNSALIFDSSVWIALLHESDSQHTKAVQLFEENTQPLLITEYVLLEVVNILVAKAGKETANAFLEFLSLSGSVHLQNVEAAELEMLIHSFSRSTDPKLSLVDHHLLSLSHYFDVVTFDKALGKAISART